MTQTLTPDNPYFHLGLPAIGGARLCGPGRTAGSLYAECGLTLAGQPLETYLMDPPQRIEPAQLGLSAQGVTVITDEHGVQHLVDLVGQSHYQNVSDLLEEVAVMGVSRKVPVTVNLAGLTAGSTLILVHARAGIENIAAVGPGTGVTCPNGRHRPGEACCAQHWITPAVTTSPDLRETQTARYRVFPPGPSAPAPVFVPAIFAAFPITALSIIRSHDGRVDARAERAARASGLPIHVANS